MQPLAGAQGQLRLLGHIEILPIHLPQEAPVHQAADEDEARNHHVKGAGIGQTQIVKSQLILQPAQQHPKGSRACDIETDFQWFFTHNPASVSISLIP